MKSGFRQAYDDEERGNGQQAYGNQSYSQQPFSNSPRNQNNAQQPYGNQNNTQQPFGNNSNYNNPQSTGNNNFNNTQPLQNNYNNSQIESRDKATEGNGQQAYGGQSYSQQPYSNTPQPYANRDNAQKSPQQPYGNQNNTQQPFGNNYNNTGNNNFNNTQPLQNNYNNTQPLGGTGMQTQYQNDPAQMSKFDEQGDPRQIYADSLYVSFSGIIEAGECEDEESLRIEYSIKYSKEDWVFLNRTSGDSEPAGISQLSTSHNLHTKNIVWNFPFECNFKTTNPFGWPQIVVRLSGPDFMGRSVLKGYGSIHVPTTAGYHERVIRIYKPLPQSWFTGMLGYLLGNTAELKNFDRVISSGEGREVTRVRSVGYVKVKFHVTLVNFEKFGYM